MVNFTTVEINSQIHEFFPEIEAEYPDLLYQMPILMA